MSRLADIMKGIGYKAAPIEHRIVRIGDDEELIIHVNGWNKARVFSRLMLSDAPDKYILEEIRYMVVACEEQRIRDSFNFNGITLEKLK